jgi:hypothetical protein
MIDDDDPLAVAEDYRRQRQRAEAKSSALKGFSADGLRRAVGSRSHIMRMTQFGLTEEQAISMISDQSMRLAQIPLGSEYDTPQGQSILGDLMRDIQSACAARGIPIGDGVVFGLSLEPTIGAGSLSVLGTQASIISVTGPLINFCSIASKLLAFTMDTEKSRSLGAGRINMDFQPEDIRGHLRQHHHLIKYWMLLIDAYARHLEGPRGLPLFNIRGNRGILRLAILRAMELFAVAHEFGHHVDYSNRKGTEKENSLLQEFGADVFAAIISKAVADKGPPPHYSDMFTFSGAGGVLMLGALDLVRRANSVLETGADEMPYSKTHPPLRARLKVLESVYISDNLEDHRLFSQTRRQLAEMIEEIWVALLPIFTGLHKLGIRPNPITPETPDWLPLFK